MGGDPLTSFLSRVWRIDPGQRMVDGSLLKEMYRMQGKAAEAARIEHGPRLLDEGQLRELATFINQMSLVDSFQETGERLTDGEAFKELALATYVPPIPVIITAPVISGSTAVGGVLSATTGTWANPPITSIYYDWRRDGTPIAQHGATYTVVTADKTHSITCAVTATNGGGNSAGPAISNALAIP